MVECIKDATVVKRLRKSRWYGRFRQYLPMAEARYPEDWDRIDDAEIATIDWPACVAKPRVGVVQDYTPYPRWTKYCRFLEKNAFPHEVYHIQAHDWLESAGRFDIIVGLISNQPCHLQEIRLKYHFLEAYLGKMCYPSGFHAMLYEDKTLEAYISQVAGIPFAATHVSHDRKDAMRLVERLTYPVVSKIVPAAGSVGVELVSTPAHARRIVAEAFSPVGRKTHLVYSRQKDYVYFQDYVPNDGYDIRAIVIGNRVFGYYRKVLAGDFRASGMKQEEYGQVPEEAMRIALAANQTIKSPWLAVDMVHGLDGRYHVIEFSPICQADTDTEMRVDGIPGSCIFRADGSFYFEQGRSWLSDLALRQFLLDDYLPRVGQ